MPCSIRNDESLNCPSDCRLTQTEQHVRATCWWLYVCFMWEQHVELTFTWLLFQTYALCMIGRFYTPPPPLPAPTTHIIRHILTYLFCLILILSVTTHIVHVSLLINSPSHLVMHLPTFSPFSLYYTSKPFFYIIYQFLTAG